LIIKEWTFGSPKRHGILKWLCFSVALLLPKASHYVSLTTHLVPLIQDHQVPLEVAGLLFPSSIAEEGVCGGGRLGKHVSIVQAHAVRSEQHASCFACSLQAQATKMGGTPLLCLQASTDGAVREGGKKGGRVHNQGGAQRQAHM